MSRQAPARDLVVDTPGNLRFSGISKFFPGVRALDSVDLVVLPGEVHGIVGENGAGKSTLMAIASGALVPDAGTVTINGTTFLHGGPDRARELGVGIVRQEPALMPDLSVAENLYLAMSPARRPHERSLLRWSETALAKWGDDVEVRPSHRVEELNPQQRFIVEICRALAQDPDVLVLDEPTEHLREHEVEVLFSHIKNHVARGKSVVYISHRVNEVKSIADRITVLRNGRSEGTYSAAELSPEQIVNLIIGRQFDAFYPDKKANAESPIGGLALHGLGAKGLSPLTMEFPSGQIIGLAGIDGSGQRALLRAIAGLENSSGSYVADGHLVKHPSQSSAVRQGIAFLAGDRHNEGILRTLNVGENIVFRSLHALSRLGWVTDRSVRRLAGAVVDDFNVKTPSLETPIESLSGGNQQKALIGSVITTKPRILLLDEPTQGVDVGARSEIYALVRQAAEDGAVVFVLSSNTLELIGVSDRVLVFSRGQVIRELDGAAISEKSITDAILSADTERISSARRRANAAQWLSGDVAPVALVAVLVAALTIVGFTSNPLFVGQGNVSGILGLAVPLALVSFGQLLALLSGGIDLSTGPLMGMVAIIGSFYLVDNSTAGSLATGWIIIVVVSVLVGVVNWVLVDVVRLAPIIATLATYMAIQGVSYILRPTPGGSISASVSGPLTAQWGLLPLAFFFTICTAAAFEYWLKHSRSGIAIRAVGSQPEAARVNTLNPRLIRFCAYVGCSALAGAAGVFLLAQTGVGDASVGVNYTLLGVTAVVVGGASVTGGRGSFLGALLGAVLISTIDSITVFLHLSTSWQYYLVGGLTIAAVALYSTARKRSKDRG